uniref:Transmembrane protein 179 n=1 Tax=Aceria tosichella TaxID=561515 RepID=A0A6G1S7C4_9ACAR
MLLLVLLCAAYSVCIILGVSFLVALINHLYSFSNHCLLFTTGKYENNGEFTPDWAAPSFCFFSIIVAFISVFVAAIELVKTSVMLYRGTRKTFTITFKMTFGALCMVILILISGIIVSAGFEVWCNAVEERFSKGCEAAAASMVIANNTENIQVADFFTDLETSQFSVWSSFVVWVLALTISGRMLFVAHERANIRISMARERRRYNHPPDHANQPSNLPFRDIT